MCINCNDPLQINLATGPQGAAGPAPGITASASTGSIGVTVTQPTTGNYNLAFTIPSGTNGTNGTNGANGVYGGVTFPYTYAGLNAGGAANPGAGNLTLGGGFGATGYVYISNANRNDLSQTTFGINLFVNTIGNVNSTIGSTPFKGLIKIFKKSDASTYVIYQISNVGYNVGDTYSTLTVTAIGYQGTLTINDDVLVSVSVSGSVSTAVNNLLNTGTLTISQVGPPNFASLGTGPTQTNTLLEPGSNGIWMLLNTAVATSTNTSVLPTGSFSATNGFWTCPTSGIYKFDWYMSLTRGTNVSGPGTGWYSSSYTPQLLIAGVLGPSTVGGVANPWAGNCASSCHWICPTADTRQAVLGGTSGAISLSAGNSVGLRLSNLTQRDYTSQSGDAIRLSISKIG